MSTSLLDLLIWPITKPRVRGSPKVEPASRVLRGQIAGMSIVVRAPAMHRAAVIPDHEIANLPFMAVDEFRPGCVECEVVQHLVRDFALPWGPSRFPATPVASLKTARPADPGRAHP